MTNRLRKPNRIDPTRSGLIRRHFEAETGRRFLALQKEVYNLIAVENVFGLEKGMTVNARWRFASAVEGLSRFREWLQERAGRLILQDDPDIDERGKWLGTHITRAYFKGAHNAENFLKKGGPDDIDPMSPYGRALTMAVNLKKIQLLKERAFEEMKGVSQALSIRLGNILADGLTRGENPLKVARQMSAEIKSLDKKRARTIARTEMARAVAEGSLDAMERRGITHIGVDVEWNATMIDQDNMIFEEKVCPKCRALAGLTIPIEKAHGMLPRHPNCRCAFIPSVLGADSNKAVRKRIRASIWAGISKKRKLLSDSEIISRENWQGADLLNE